MQSAATASAHGYLLAGWQFARACQLALVENRREAHGAQNRREETRKRNTRERERERRVGRNLKASRRRQSAASRCWRVEQPDSSATSRHHHWRQPSGLAKQTDRRKGGRAASTRGYSFAWQRALWGRQWCSPHRALPPTRKGRPRLHLAGSSGSGEKPASLQVLVGARSQQCARARSFAWPALPSSSICRASS